MTIWQQLFNRRMAICIFTGFASGLPLYLLLNLVPVSYTHLTLPTICSV